MEAGVSYKMEEVKMIKLPRVMLERIVEKVRDLAPGFRLGVKVFFVRVKPGVYAVSAWLSAVDAEPVNRYVPRDFDVTLYFEGGGPVSVWSVAKDIAEAVYEQVGGDYDVFVVRKVPLVEVEG